MTSSYARKDKIPVE